MAEASVLSQHQCQPREGHLSSVYRMSRYLKWNLKEISGRIAFNYNILDIENQLFNPGNNSVREEFYPDAEEAITGSSPPPRGNPVYVGCYVDANHAGNLLTRRSHTGIITFVNKYPIICHSKRQNIVESSRFGSKFIALQIATKMIEVLSYKLRMFGVPINWPADVFCDNQSVITNVSIPYSVLNNIHNYICYHRVWEADKTGAIQVGWISGEYNKADIGIKTTIYTKRRYKLLT